MEGGDGPHTHLGGVGDGHWQGSPSPTLSQWEQWEVCSQSFMGTWCFWKKT